MADWLDRVLIRFRRDRLVDHYRAVFDSDSGRIVLADLAREGGLLATTEGLDAEQTQFTCGKRHMITYVMGALRKIPRDLNEFGNLRSED